MSWLSDAWDDVEDEFKRTTKKLSKEAKRLGQQVGDVADKSLDILMTPGPLGKMMMGDDIDSASSDAAGPLAIPDPPIAYGMEGEGAYSSRRKSIKSGRGGTILAGPLSPGNVGKKILG